MGVCCIYAHSLFTWDDNRDIRGLNCAMLEFISATFLWGKTSDLKFKYSIILKNVLAVN